MAQYFNLEVADSSPTSESGSSLRIAIQDSTGNNHTDLQPLVRVLEKAGYRNIYIAKRWGEPLDVTHVVAQQGDDNSAQSIRNSLGFGEVRVESTGNLASDISIQVGKDWFQQRSLLEQTTKQLSTRS